MDLEAVFVVRYQLRELVSICGSPHCRDDLMLHGGGRVDNNSSLAERDDDLRGSHVLPSKRPITLLYILLSAHNNFLDEGRNYGRMLRPRKRMPVLSGLS